MPGGGVAAPLVRLTSPKTGTPGGVYGGLSWCGSGRLDSGLAVGTPPVWAGGVNPAGGVDWAPPTTRTVPETCAWSAARAACAASELITVSAVPVVLSCTLPLAARGGVAPGA